MICKRPRTLAITLVLKRYYGFFKIPDRLWNNNPPLSVSLILPICDISTFGSAKDCTGLLRMQTHALHVTWLSRIYSSSFLLNRFHQSS